MVSCQSVLSDADPQEGHSLPALARRSTPNCDRVANRHACNSWRRRIPRLYQSRAHRHPCGSRATETVAGRRSHDVKKGEGHETGEGLDRNCGGESTVRLAGVKNVSGRRRQSHADRRGSTESGGVESGFAAGRDVPGFHFPILSHRETAGPSRPWNTSVPVRTAPPCSGPRGATAPRPRGWAGRSKGSGVCRAPRSPVRRIASARYQTARRSSGG